MIRKECDTCLSWDIPKDMCLRVSHGMACVVGELSPGAWAKIPPTPDWETQLAAMPAPNIKPPPGAVLPGSKDDRIYARIAKNHRAGDTQVAGDHYKKMGVEPWDVVDTWPLEQRIGAYRHGALKYLMRMGSKDQNAQEIAKGKHYMEKLLEVLNDA